jgi:hypothetical protein
MSLDGEQMRQMLSILCIIAKISVRLTQYLIQYNSAWLTHTHTSTNTHTTTNIDTHTNKQTNFHYFFFPQHKLRRTENLTVCTDFETINRC